MSLIEEQAEFLRDVRKLLQFADDQKFLVTGGELERAPELQEIYVRSGREKTMDNLHVRKCAIALNFFRPTEAATYRLVQTVADLEEVGRFWEQLDPRNRWGGRRGVLEALQFERDLGAWPSSAVSTLSAPTEPLENVGVALAGERPTVFSVVSATADSLTPTLKRGISNSVAITRLQTLLNNAGMNCSLNGIFDAQTERAAIEYQSKNSLIADGVIGEKTWTKLLGQTSAVQTQMAERFLGEDDLKNAAKTLDVDLACIKAVYKVESRGKGFVGDYPKILFEGHVFWRRLKLRNLNPEVLARGNEDILYPKWTKQFYVGGAGEVQRLHRAEAIQREAALESASWGLFQIMGYHWKTLKYDSADDFVERMCRHERDQLDAFCRFIKINTDHKGRPLVDVLRNREWAAFALAYNGAGYRENAYDDKLRDAYLSYSKAA